MERFWSKVDRRGPDECWPWKGARSSGGYGQLRLSRNRLVYAHRLASELRYGPVPPGLRVLHDCDNPPCCNPRHLFCGTQADNVADMLAKKLHGQAKLVPADVRAIRSDARTLREIATEYGVHKSLISLIKRRTIWEYVA